MTDAALAAEGFQISVSCLLFFGVYFAIRKLQTEDYRGRVFAVRDRLWDRALELDAFQDPAYLATRETANAMIRAAPSTNMLAVWVVEAIDRRFGHKTPPRPRSDRPDVQEAVWAAQDDLIRCYERHLAVGSLLGSLAFVASAVRRAIARRAARPA